MSLWARCRPDGLTFAALVALTVILFSSVGTLPDWQPGAAEAARRAKFPTGSLPVQDFAYIFNYARRAVETPGVSPYSVEQHRAFLTAWMGPHVASALCFAYSPLVVLLLVPLFPLPTTWAWLVWNLLGAWAAAWGLRRLAGADGTLLSIGRLVLISPTAFHCLALGQTALLATGGLTAILALGRSDSGFSSPATWVTAACLLVLAAKPPLAVVAAVALLAADRWRPVVVATGAALVVLAGAILWWSVALVPDYLALVGRYNVVDANPLFRAGYTPGFMSNLRNALLRVTPLDDARASGMSALVLAPVLALPVLLAVALRRAIAPERALAWTVMGYALFSPHLSPTEDLLLLLPLAAVWHARVASRVTRALATACVVGSQFVGASAAFVVAGSGGAGALVALPLVAFAAKLVLGGLVAGVLLDPQQLRRMP